MKAGRKAGLGLAILGGVMAVGGLYTWHRLRQFIPARPNDAKDAGHIMMQGGMKVLAITNQLGDLEIFAGGALRRMYQMGNPITIVSSSSQERGRCILDYEQVDSIHLSQKTLADSQSLNQEIRQICQEQRPHLVLSYDHAHLHPWIFNQDSVDLGEAVVHTVNEIDLDCLVYLFGSAKPTVAVDIGPVVKQKTWALANLAPRRVGTWTRRLAALTARGTGFRYAEAFRSLHNVHTFVPPVANMPSQKRESSPTDQPPN